MLHCIKSKRPSQWDPPIKLEHLTESQQQIVRQLLKEECNAFSFDDNDVGCIPTLNMHITLHDKSPVQKTYISVPKPLLQEVKEYLQDLLNRGWISKSRSPYSSPVVCVRKKDGSLRLCCDYRQLNRKSVPDRHPIPRIQDTLDSLSGSSWFSVLDQGKAYHKGFLDEESRPLTAFVTPWGLFQWNRIPLNWNDLPTPIRNAGSLSIFKQQLKTHLFQLYLTTLKQLKKKKSFTFFQNLHLSLCVSLLPLLACTYMNNALDLVLLALPLYVCLFKINRFMYSPIVSRFG